MQNYMKVSQSEKKLRIGVMGCANIAQRSVIPAIISLPGHFLLSAVSSRTNEKAQSCADHFNTKPIVGYENLLDRSDIDAIYMPLPTGLHEEWVMKTLEAGKHIIVEKSLAIDFKSAIKMIELAKQKNLLIMENFMYKYHAQHKAVWEQLRNNSLGTIKLYRSQFGFPPLSTDNFRYDKSLGGGALLDAAAYTISSSLWFLGNDQEVISSALYFDKKKNIDIYGNASILNKEGVVSQLSFGFDNYYRCNYEFWGSKGILTAPKAFTPKPDENTKIVFESKGDVITNEIKPDNHFTNMLQMFHQGVINGDHRGHYDDILAQSKIISAVRNNAIRKTI